MKVFNLKQLQKLSIILLILSFSITTKAQLYQKRADIIEDLGDNFTADSTDDGTKYILYEKEYTTDASGTYTRNKIIYFVELEDGTEICNMWKIIEPSSETNSNVKYFRNQDYVFLGSMQWKDYESSILYDIIVKDGFCIITAIYDDKT